MTEPGDAHLAGLIDEWLGPEPVGDEAAGCTATPRLHAAVHAIERTWDLVIPRRLFAQVRDRAELVEALVTRVRRHVRLRARRQPVPRAARVQVRVQPPAARGIPELTRSGAMSAYDVEDLLESVRRWGPGTRIEVVVRDERDARMANALRERAAGLGHEAVTVTVRHTPAAR